MVAGIRKTSKRQHPDSKLSLNLPCQDRDHAFSVVDQLTNATSVQRKNRSVIIVTKLDTGRTHVFRKQRTTHKGSKQKSAGRQKQTVHELHREEPSDIEFDELNFDCIDTSADGMKPMQASKSNPFKNQIANLHGKIDTGSQGNVLPLGTYHKMYPDDSNT